MIFISEKINSRRSNSTDDIMIVGDVDNQFCTTSSSLPLSNSFNGVVFDTSSSPPPTMEGAGDNVCVTINPLSILTLHPVKK
jgi:hypothetical protein